MKASDQFHTGIIVEDFEGTLAYLSELYGYEWCDEIRIPTQVELPSGGTTIDLAFVYSKTVPRLEVIRSRPGTLWSEASGSGIHHLGFWSDDVSADSERMIDLGLELEASGRRPDGEPYWAYHKGRSGPRIELVSRDLQPALEHYWSTGRLS